MAPALLVLDLCLRSVRDAMKVGYSSIQPANRDALMGIICQRSDNALRALYLVYYARMLHRVLVVLLTTI